MSKKPKTYVKPQITFILPTSPKYRTIMSLLKVEDANNKKQAELTPSQS